MPLSLVREGTVSDFSREPKVVSHFSRGPEPPRHPSGGPVVTAHASPAHTTVSTANGAESPSARRFGEILVDEKYITAEQLEAALRLQAVSPTYVPIGQVLLANKLVTRRQLDALLHRHKKRSRLGEILVKAGRITTAQLHEALAYQRRTPMPVRQALIRKLKGAIARLYGPAMPPDVDAFRVRNILIGPIRDQLVVELVAKGLRGVSIVPPGWQ